MFDILCAEWFATKSWPCVPGARLAGKQRWDLCTLIALHVLLQLLRILSAPGVSASQSCTVKKLLLVVSDKCSEDPAFTRVSTTPGQIKTVLVNWVFQSFRLDCVLQSPYVDLLTSSPVECDFVGESSFKVSS